MYHMEQEVKLRNNYSRAKLVDTVTSFELLARAAGGPRGNISVAVRYILPLHVRNVAIKAVWP